MGALSWVVTLRLGPSLPKSQIQSRWSHQADKMSRHSRVHPRAGWGRVSSPPRGPGNVVVFAHSHSRGKIQARTQLPHLLRCQGGSGPSAGAEWQHLYPFSSSHFHLSFFPVCLPPCLSLCLLFLHSPPPVSPCWGGRKAGAASRLTKAAGGEGRSGRGFV